MTASGTWKTSAKGTLRRDHVVRFSPRALIQLDELESYIARASSPGVAVKSVDAIRWPQVKAGECPPLHAVSDKRSSAFVIRGDERGFSATTRLTSRTTFAWTAALSGNFFSRCIQEATSTQSQSGLSVVTRAIGPGKPWPREHEA